MNLSHKRNLFDGILICILWNEGALYKNINEKMKGAFYKSVIMEMRMEL